MVGGLLIPIRIEALWLPANKAVTEAAEDFTRLPYCDRARDINPDIAYISEEIVSQPFQNQNLYLQAGLHLHWFLPSALARGTVNQVGTTYPRVPDRWLMTRHLAGAAKQWVVESDYLHPEGEGQGCVAYPLTKKELKELHGDEFCAPYRCLGRALKLEDWLALPRNSSDKYLNEVSQIGLTAMGYGLPTFAAFYPNCHSVFGFYDPEIKDALPKDLKYSVIGWYSNPDDDFLKKYLAQISLKEDQKVADLLREAFDWQLPETTQGTDLQRMFCGGVVSIQDPQTEAQDSNSSRKKVAIANSEVEALSACLADKIIGPIDEKLTEEQKQLIALPAVMLPHKTGTISSSFLSRFRQMLRPSGQSLPVLLRSPGSRH